MAAPVNRSRVTSDKVYCERFLVVLFVAPKELCAVDYPLFLVA